MSFPEDIKARGLHDTATLPQYPWRDDGILVWIAIHKFVGSYFEHFYPSDADVEQDSEIQVQTLPDPASVRCVHHGRQLCAGTLLRPAENGLKLE